MLSWSEVGVLALWAVLTGSPSYVINDSSSEDDVAVSYPAQHRIEVNYQRMAAEPELLPFVIQHEIGHVFWQHYRGIPKDEMQADCYAVQHVTRAQALTAYMWFLSQGPFRLDTEHPSGYERAAHIRECAPGKFAE